MRFWRRKRQKSREEKLRPMSWVRLFSLRNKDSICKGVQWWHLVPHTFDTIVYSFSEIISGLRASKLSNRLRGSAYAAFKFSVTTTSLPRKLRYSFGLLLFWLRLFANFIVEWINWQLHERSRDLALSDRFSLYSLCRSSFISAERRQSLMGLFYTSLFWLLQMSGIS